MSAKDTTAILNYFSPPPDGSRSYSYINGPDITETSADEPIDLQSRNWRPVRHHVPVHDVRGREDLFDVDKNGFQFFKHITKETDFPDDEEKLQGYYDEAIEAIKQQTSATRVVIFDHTIRRNKPGDTEKNGPLNRHPVPLAHIDQTPESTVSRIHRHLPAEDVPNLLKHRYQIINFWRPIRNPAIDWPLALCDFASLDPEKDLVPSTLKYPDRDGETYSVQWSNRHTWYYKSGMTPDDVVLIKCYDSKKGVATYTAHTAFRDPNTPPDALLRQSIELRALVFHDEENE